MKKRKNNKIKQFVTATLALLLVVGLAGLVFSLTKKPNEENPTKKATPVAVRYNPTFGEKFEEEMPISALTSLDNMSVAPYAYQDTTLFSGKRITKISAPVGTVKAVDENQYFTLWVVKTDVVKSGGKIEEGTEKTYKIYLPKAELASTSVNKWITIDLSKQFIYVGSDETLAFMKSNDPVTCRYSGLPKYPFVYNLTKSGTNQPNQSIYYSIWTDDVVNLKGKNVSVLGDSISTYAGISNDSVNTNSTIGNNVVFFPNSGVIKDSSLTWWDMSIKATKANLLVNNSWSGSRVFNGSGSAYQTRATELHDDTGENKGTNPDIIAVYIGVNDFNGKIEVGTYKKLSEVYTKTNGYITPSNFSQAYAIMLHKMTQKYNKADIFVFTLPYNGTNKDTATMDKYNENIRYIANSFGCHIVDLAEIDGYDYSKYTSDNLHPNEEGMQLIADLFTRTLKGFYGKK